MTITSNNLPIYIKNIEKMLTNQEIKCMCGNILKPSNIEFYKYPKSREYWIYAHCPNCQYDYNYEKITRQYKNKLLSK